MLGNHDTPPVWRLADGWLAEGTARAQADYLATRLVPDPAERDAWAARTAADAGALVQARAADLFVGPAGNVMVFFTDLFGMRELYNRPGVISPDNWSLRVPADYQRLYRERLGRNRAINLPLALAAALRARGLDAHRPDLVKELDRLAG
jgi:4-alpha-glucanotransferase